MVRSQNILSIWCYFLVNYKFSGHETFPCRYAWLPKAFLALESDQEALSDEEDAMVRLGVGKNMLRAIKFWIQATGIARASREGGFLVTEFGRAILAENGFDPFLEDRRTLWLIHWNIATLSQEPLFAWYFMLNRWQHPEISRKDVLQAFALESQAQARKLSPVTLEQHFEVFLHTYVPTRGRKGEIQEDNLDCPLVELELIQQVGERELERGGRREPIYAFRREEKPDISPALFIYCLQDFWRRNKASEKTLGFRHAAVAPGSPGQIFKLPEADIRSRLEALEEDSAGEFEYHESSTSQQITCKDNSALISQDFLAAIYKPEVIYA